MRNSIYCLWYYYTITEMFPYQSKMPNKIHMHFIAVYISFHSHSPGLLEEWNYTPYSSIYFLMLFFAPYLLYLKHVEDRMGDHVFLGWGHQIHQRVRGHASNLQSGLPMIVHHLYFPLLHHLVAFFFCFLPVNCKINNGDKTVKNVILYYVWWMQ